jgi:hypothetical protein
LIKRDSYYYTLNLAQIFSSKKKRATTIGLPKKQCYRIRPWYLNGDFKGVDRRTLKILAINIFFL